MFGETLPRPIWNTPLAEFLGPGRVTPGLGVEHDAFCTVRESMVDLATLASVEALTEGAVEAPDYSLAVLKSGRDVVLLFDDGSGDLEPVGQYVGDSVHIIPSHRRQGLSIPLILAAAGLRGGTPTRGDFTSAGYAAHRQAHRFIVGWAVEQGLAVPPDVLVDYPNAPPRTATPTG